MSFQFGKIKSIESYRGTFALTIKQVNKVEHPNLAGAPFGKSYKKVLLVMQIVVD